MILKEAKAGDRTKALANAKSVVGALLAFKADYGAYPCDATRGELAKEGFTKNNRWSKNNLAEGTNGFAYIMAKNRAPLTDTKSYTPLILAGIVSKGAEPVFAPEIFGGKFVFGRVDGSSEAGDLDENGHATSKGRKSFFQTGPDSLFGKDTPVVKYPLFPKP
ncbi:hypothetical protein N9Y81_02860 [Akkermansiaceae bacterium]|nr:hypothetical protein [Akkermansiaceae bacterium]